MSSEIVEVPVVEVKPVKPPRVIKSMKCWSENAKYIIRNHNQLITDNFVIRNNLSKFVNIV